MLQTYEKHFTTTSSGRYFSTFYIFTLYIICRNNYNNYCVLFPFPRNTIWAFFQIVRYFLAFCNLGRLPAPFSIGLAWDASMVSAGHFYHFYLFVMSLVKNWSMWCYAVMHSLLLIYDIARICIFLLGYRIILNLSCYLYNLNNNRSKNNLISEAV